MRTLTLIIFILFFSNLKAQLTVSNGAPYNSANNLINQVLMSSTTGNVAQNVTLSSGVPSQIGYFNGTSSNINIDEGVILSTGGIGVSTPQNDGNQNVNFPSEDPDLRSILLNIASTNQIQKNTIVLEFDFVAGGDFVEFEYVFASNEYNMFTCSRFNDVFGFFLSGPGISGPYSNNAKNIALVPNVANPNTFTSTPVMINTVNSGSATGSNSDVTACSNIDPNWSSYSTFFIDNPVVNTVNFNGFTTVLKAKSNVQCGETYHIKLAITDVGDESFNSGVFLKKGSFEVGYPLEIGIKDQVNFVKCEDNVIVNPLIEGGFGAVSVEWTKDGVFFSNDKIVTLTENGIYKLVVTDICGSISHTITVSDYTPLELELPDTIILCELTTIIPDVSGGAPQFDFTWSGSGISSNIEELVLTPGVNGIVNLKIDDQCGFSISDEVFVFTPEELSVEAIDFVYLCERELILEGEYFGGHGEVEFYWEFKGEKFYSKTLDLTDASSGIASFHAIDECDKHRIVETNVISPGPILPIEISYEKQTFNVCSRDVFRMPIEVSGGAGNTLKYDWYLNDILISNEANYNFNGASLNDGENVVKLVLSDVCDNSLTDYFKLYLLDCYVPNVITPENDLVNDGFYFPVGDLQEKVELTIYDRWGIRVYYSTNYEDRCNPDTFEGCWKGEYQSSGRQNIDGVYYYLITFENGIVEKGTVNIFNEK